MVRQPKTLDEAKQIFREERAKVTSSLSAIAGSRWLMAILATFVIAFGVNLLYSPQQLPSVGGLSLAAVGLPPSVDFGFAGEQAAAARDAAVREGGVDRVGGFLAAHAESIPALNAVGFGLALALLLTSMTIMTRRRRFTRG